MLQPQTGAQIARCRLEMALAGAGCDFECHDQLQHTISVHVRGRHVAAEWCVLSYFQVSQVVHAFGQTWT